MLLAHSKNIPQNAYNCIFSTVKQQKNFWGGGTAPSQTPPPPGREYPLPDPILSTPSVSRFLCLRWEGPMTMFHSFCRKGGGKLVVMPLSECQWYQLGHMQIGTSPQTDDHASTPPLSFLQAIVMWHWHCGVDVSYRQLSDWTCVQWALHS